MNRVERIAFQVTPEEKREIEDAAQAVAVKPAAWARMLVLAAARRKDRADG
jgi:hypothetical protein